MTEQQLLAEKIILHHRRAIERGDAIKTELKSLDIDKAFGLAIHSREETVVYIAGHIFTCLSVLDGVNIVMTQEPLEVICDYLS